MYVVWNYLLPPLRLPPPELWLLLELWLLELLELRPLELLRPLLELDEPLDDELLLL